MSADNWAVCPKCAKIRAQDLERMEETLKLNYGKIPLQEFLDQREAYHEKRGEKPEYDLREDYELGICEGEFYVSYRARCIKCEWEYSFKHTQSITLEDK